MLNKVFALKAAVFASVLSVASTYGVAAPSATAETSVKDLKVAARAVRFLQPAPSGDVTAYVVFDPNSPSSVADADKIIAGIGGGIKAGKAQLKPYKVAVNELDAVASSGAVIIVATGAPAVHSKVNEIAGSKSMLTVSSDLDCVRSGQCVVGVATTPKVQIIVNKSAAGAASVKFKSAFMMLVEQL